MKTDDDTPFGRAIKRNDVAAAIKVARADSGVTSLNLKSSYRTETALHAAVRIDSAELVEILLDYGMDVDTPDGEGYTPLFLAPELGASLAVVKLLVERGADIHVDNDNPLWSAVWQVSYGFGGMPLLRYLVKQGSKPRGLTHAAEAGKLRIVRLLVELGADVNEIDSEGHTPLDYATGAAQTFMKQHVSNKKSCDYPAVIEYLLAHGARRSAPTTSSDESA